MADRITRVSLVAQVNNYVAGMNQAAASTTRVAGAANDLANKHAAYDKLGKSALAFGAVSAGAVALAVAKFAEFDKAMSGVQAATHASSKAMGQLREAAIDAGAKTVFSATEAADAITELSKAGISTTAILNGGLSGALSLASAGQLGVADAAGIAASALTQFNLKGSDVPHVADLLAAGAGKAQGSVEDLSQALNQGGLVASQAGFSINETTGTLAAFASAGLLGSDAGTSLKTAILALESPSTTASAVMKQYGIDVYDSQGKMDSFSEIAGTLQSKLGGLTDEQRNSALATIFGTDAVRAASVLYKNGASGIDEWNKKVNDTGYAAETSRLQLNNLQGDLEALGGAFDSALIQTGSGANGVLRGLTQGVTGLVNVVGGLPEPVLATGLGLTAVASGVALTGGAALVAIPKVAAFQATLATLSTSNIPRVANAAGALTTSLTRSGAALASTASFLTGPFGLSIAAATVGIAALSRYLGSLEASSAEVTNSLKTSTSAAEIFRKVSEGRNVTAWADVNAQLSDLPKLLEESDKQAGNVFARFTGSEYFGAIKALKEVGTQLGTLAESDLPGAQHGFSLLAEQTDGSRKELEQLLNSMPDYKTALVAQATSAGVSASEHNLLKLAQGQASDTTASTAAAYEDASKKAADLTSQLDSLITTLNTSNASQQDAISANSTYQAAIAGISTSVQQQKDAYEEAHKTLDGFSLSLDSNSASGAANLQMLSQAAGSAQAYADKQYAVDKTTMSAKDATDKYVSTLGTSRDNLVKAATAAGYNKDAVQRLIDKVFQLPTTKQVKLLTDTAAAVKGIDDVATRLSRIPRSLTTLLNIKTTETKTIAPFVSQAAKDAAMKGGKAGGGAIDGPGPKGKDSVLAYVAPGEHVFTASDVDKAGGQAAVYRIRDAIQAGDFPRFAAGGAVDGAKADYKRATAKQKADQKDLTAAIRASEKAARDERAADNDKEKATARAARTAADRSIAERRRIVAADQRETDAAAAAVKVAVRQDARAKAEAERQKKAADAAAAAEQKAQEAFTARVDFRSTVRSGDFTGASGVSSLYRMAVDDDYSKKARRAFATTADKAEKMFGTLEKRSTVAAAKVSMLNDKLGDLQSASASTVASIAGKLGDSGLTEAQTATGFAANLSTKRARGVQLGKALKKLQKEGLSPALLTEIAGMGIDDGLLMAQSFEGLSLSAIRKVNSDYAAVQATATAIGTQVADANYGKLIDAAQKQLDGAEANAKAITDQIAKSTARLEKIIGHALGIKGYSAGGYTGSGRVTDVKGLVHAGEFVTNAQATARPGNRAMLEAMNAGRPGFFGGGYVQPTYMRSGGSGSGVDLPVLVRSVVKEMQAARPTEFIYQATPIRDQDPQTSAAITAREFERASRGQR